MRTGYSPGMASATQALYTAEAMAAGGRVDGRARTADGRFAVDVVVPGSDADGTNPEELFALGYAACFNNAVLVSARRRRQEPGDVQVTARVHLGRDDGGRYGLAVELETTVPGLSQDDAEDLVRQADERCPYSNAIRGNVTIEHVVRGSAGGPPETTP